MRIAQISPLIESVPPKLYGGTERVVSYLTEALVELGHEVTLFASKDSCTKAKLMPICLESLRIKEVEDPAAYHTLEMELVYQQADQFDIIHNHNDYLAFPLARRSATPTVTTLHGRLDKAELFPLYKEFKDMPLVSISNSQRAPLPLANWVGTVYHGLPLNLYHYRENPEDYLVFIGRMSCEKRVDAAVQIAKQAKRPLKIAAKIDSTNENHYRTMVEPLFDSSINYIGEIAEKDKNEFLGNAYSFLFPIDWPEPFGLVMIEAMACGTPLIARRRGAISEIIDHGVTGFIFEENGEAAEAVNKIPTLSRKKCREVFEERFSDTIMAQNYLKIYEKVIEQWRK